MPSLSPEDYLDKFEVEWEKVSGVAYRVTSMNELESVFQKILVLAETQAIALSRNPILKELQIVERLASLNKFATSWTGGVTEGTHSLSDFNKASFAAGAGITGVDFVLAESGTLVLSSATEGVQVASLAPPIHIALFRRHQIVGSLDEVLAKIPSSSSQDRLRADRSVGVHYGLPTGLPDIEQILIKERPRST